MSKRTTADYAAIRKKLHEVLEPHYPGIDISVEYADRWKRTCLTFRHEHFAPWLNEQRFRNIVRRIPPDFYEEELRGSVWFELAPGESVQDALESKRSEDVAGIEAGIFKKLIKGKFFAQLADTIGDKPDEACLWTFDRTRGVLDKMGIRGEAQDDVCLVFIRHGAHCDSEVLLVAHPSLIEAHG